MIKTKHNKLKYVLIIAFLVAVLLFCVPFNSNKVEAQTNNVREFNAITNNYTDDEIANIDYYCLKDDNIIFTPNQNPLGTCWTFGGIKSIETALSLATNEVYDFSEAWISLIRAYDSTSYTIGDGGSSNTFDSLISKYGLVLERDMPYEVLSKIDCSSTTEVKKYFDYYSQFANKDIVKLLTSHYKIDSSIFLGTTSYDFIKFIKSSIINYGSCDVAFNADGTYLKSNSKNNIDSYHCESFTKPNHEVSAIGWDDNITLASNPNVKGAFIVQNSWGNYKDESYIYIFYENKSLLTALSYSIDLSQLNSYVKLSESSSDLKNWYSHIASSSSNEVEEKSLNQGNVFYTGENLDLTYSFVNNINYSNVKLDILDGDNKVKDITVSRNSNKIHLTKNNLTENACYTLRFYYDINDNDIIDSDEEVYYKQIFVTDGIIFDGILSGSNYSTQAFQSHSVDVDNVYITNDSNSKVYIGSYSKITKIEEVATTNSVDFIDKLNADSFAKATNSSYSTGNLVINYNNSKLSLNQWYTNKIKLTNIYGGTKIINIHYLKVSDVYSDIVWLNYLTDYKNVEGLPKFTSKANIMDLNPANGYTGYDFAGWYLDADLSNEISNNQLKSNNVYETSSKKSYFNKGKQFLNVALYPKYESNIVLNVKDTTVDAGTYGANYTGLINCVVKGSGNYIFTYKSGNIPQGLTITNNQITGVPTKVGTFTFTINVKDVDYDLEKECNITITVQKMNLVYKITKANSEVGSELVNASLSLVSGSIYNNDNVVIIDYSKVDKNVVGTYDLSVTNLMSDCYNISLSNPQDAKYVVTYKIISASVKNINCNYDGLAHSLQVTVTNADINDCEIMYSLDNNNYQSEMNFIDATSETIRVYVKISSKSNSFEPLLNQATVDINKANLTISIDKTSFEYNYEEQIPNVSILGVVNNEVLEYDILGASKTIGKHNVTVELKGKSKQNYNIVNNNLEFEITKLSPTYTLPEIFSDELLLLQRIGDLKLPIVEDGFEVEILNGDDELKEGDNVVKFKITPIGENAEIYETIIGEYHIEKQKQSLQLDSTFYIIVSIIVVVCAGIVVSVITLKNKANKNLVTISFVTNSTLPLKPIKGKINNKQSLPIPFKPGSKFEGWYVDKELTVPYKDNGKNPEMKLYAKWTIENKPDFIRPDLSSFQRYK